MYQFSYILHQECGINIFEKTFLSINPLFMKDGKRVILTLKLHQEYSQTGSNDPLVVRVNMTLLDSFDSFWGVSLSQSY